MSRPALKLGAFEAERRSEEIDGVLGAIVPAKGRVIDIGCGDGSAAFALAAPGRHVVAVDIDHDRMRVGMDEAKRRGLRVTYVRADARRLPIRDETCDGAIMYGVLEHVRNPGEAIRECGRVLRPNGTVYLVTPNPYSPITLADDPHSHLPCTHVLPMGLARRYAAALGRWPPSLGDAFVHPSWGLIARELRQAGMSMELRLQIVDKLERPRIILTPWKRRLAASLRKAGVSRFARARVARPLLLAYHRHVARSWSIVARKA